MKTEIIFKSELYKNVRKGVKSADKKCKDVMGAMGIITKFWNNGYGDAAKVLGFSKPSELRTYIVKTIKNLDGLHENLHAVNDKKEVIYAVWAERYALDMDDEKCVIDAKGNKTYPYILDKDGNKVKESYFKLIKSWTPSLVFEILAQNSILNEASKIVEKSSKVEKLKETKSSAKKSTKKSA